MNLVGRYVSVAAAVDTKKFVSYLKKRGHLSLLPRIVRALERSHTQGRVVLVASQDAVTGAHKKFPDASVVVDPKVVGGYIVRDGSTVTDASYRNALVQLYHNTIR